MKAFLLTAAAFMACAGSMFAQNLPPVYSWEVGVNAGLSVITRPLGPAEGYQGTRTNVVHDYSLRANHFFNEHWMIALDIGDRRWETFGDWKMTDVQGQGLKSRQVSFLVADHAVTESVQMNYVIPFYSQFQTYNNANLYFGAMFGMVTTVNDNSIGKSQYNAFPDSSFTYVSSYHYGYGVGYSFGLQMGFTYNIMERLGVNVEVAIRTADVGTNDIRYGSENSRFHLLYFPETIGLRWRF